MRRHVPVLPCLLLAFLPSLGGCRATDEPSVEVLSPAQILLERALRHHDPEHAWGRTRVPIRWTSTRPDGTTGYALDIELEPDGTFAMRGTRKGHAIEYRVQDDVVRVRVDGQEEISAEVREEMVLDRDGGLFWRDYLGFLAGMPMCLVDPDVQLEPEVSETELDGRPVLSIRAGFAPEVGTDVWTFYFDPETAALIGCRFDRADPTKDGETIVFEGSSSVAGLRLPRRRRWYMNADRRFLGTDELRASSAIRQTP